MLIIIIIICLFLDILFNLQPNNVAWSTEINILKLIYAQQDQLDQPLFLPSALQSP